MSPTSKTSANPSLSDSEAVGDSSVMAPKNEESAVLWRLADAEAQQSEAVEFIEPVVLAAKGPRPFTSSMPVVGPVLVTVGARAGVDDAIAVLISGEEIALGAQTARVATAVNGSRVSAGMLLLHHGDRIDAGGNTYWVAASVTPREELYDPEVHDPDQFCFRTKIRFSPGDPVVLCPGPPGRRCGILYSKAAWATGLPCHAQSCQFDPKAPAWQPPRARAASSVAALLERALAAGKERQLAKVAGEVAR